MFHWKVWLIDWLCGVRLMSQSAAITGLLFAPSGWSWAWEPWWWCRLWVIHDSSTRALWQSYQQRHLVFVPSGWSWAWEPWWWWCRLGIIHDSSTRALWQSYQQRHLGRVGGMDEGMRISRIQYSLYVNGSFICRKILRHGASGLTSRPKAGVLRTERVSQYIRSY
jgi:hypothetical protein